MNAMQGPHYCASSAWSPISLPPSSSTTDLKRSFIIIPSAGQKGNRVNYRLVCRLLIKPQLNIKTQGKCHFPLRASSLSELRSWRSCLCSPGCVLFPLQIFSEGSQGLCPVCKQNHIFSWEGTQNWKLWNCRGTIGGSLETVTGHDTQGSRSWPTLHSLQPPKVESLPSPQLVPPAWPAHCCEATLHGA